MKSQQNDSVKNKWPEVAVFEEDAYLCSIITEEMSEETLLTGMDDEETTLKPYTREELLEMAETGRKQIAEGKCFTTEEVLQYCDYDISAR